MTIEKKSLISTLKTTKKANVASSEVPEKGEKAVRAAGSQRLTGGKRLAGGKRFANIRTGSVGKRG
jgi:hypothetical protein